MILAKVNHIEVLSVTPEGLRPIKQFTINGRVEVMKFFRPQGLNKDRLFIVTAKNNAMILEADDSGNTLEIITKARGDVGDRIGQNAQTGTRAIIGNVQFSYFFPATFLKVFAELVFLANIRGAVQRYSKRDQK